MGLQVPPLGGLGRQCTGNVFGESFPLLGQPPLDSHPPVAVQIATSSLGDLPDGCSFVGWNVLVGPTSQNARQGESCGVGPAQVGIVPKLPGRFDASYKVAPSLYSVVRLLLERKQVSDQSITLHLKPSATLQRYDGAFKTFWAFASEKGYDVHKLSVDQVASILLLMSAINENQARHAYSACLLLPGFESLRFCTLLRRVKIK